MSQLVKFLGVTLMATVPVHPSDQLIACLFSRPLSSKSNFLRSVENRRASNLRNSPEQNAFFFSPSRTAYRLVLYINIKGIQVSGVAL